MTFETSSVAKPGEYTGTTRRRIGTQSWSALGYLARWRVCRHEALVGPEAERLVT